MFRPFSPYNLVSRSHFGQVADILNDRMTECNEKGIYNLGIWKRNYWIA